MPEVHFDSMHYCLVRLPHYVQDTKKIAAEILERKKEEVKLTPAIAKQKLGGRKTDSAGESSEPSTDSSTEDESEYEIEEIYQVGTHIIF